MLRYLNMFVIIGLALIGVSLAGFATHNRFIMEPGQSQTDHLSLIYFGAGVLMLINGLVSIRIAPLLPTEPKHLPDQQAVEESQTDEEIEDREAAVRQMKV